MNLELNLAGDTLQLNLGLKESDLLYSFLEFFSRKRNENVSDEEFELVENIKKELAYFID